MLVIFQIQTAIKPILWQKTLPKKAKADGKKEKTKSGNRLRISVDK